MPEKKELSGPIIKQKRAHAAGGTTVAKRKSASWEVKTETIYRNLQFLSFAARPATAAFFLPNDGG
jgi:hypothetical protein